MSSTDPEEEYSDHAEEHEGGPTKTFLEHLEDLRWVLMKCAAIIAVTFMLCLFASPTLVEVLKRPLIEANIHNSKHSESIILVFGGG